MNACWRISVMVLGRVMLVRAQDLKAPMPISLTPSPMVTFFSA